MVEVLVQCNTVVFEYNMELYNLTMCAYCAYVNQMRQVGLYCVYVFMHRKRRLEVLVSMSVGCPMVINVAAQVTFSHTGKFSHFQVVRNRKYNLYQSSIQLMTVTTARLQYYMFGTSHTHMANIQHLLTIDM